MSIRHLRRDPALSAQLCSEEALIQGLAPFNRRLDTLTIHPARAWYFPDRHLIRSRLQKRHAANAIPWKTLNQLVRASTGSVPRK